MEGIIGCQVLSDICIPFVGISINPYSFYTLVIKVRLVFYKLVYVDIALSQTIVEKQDIKQIHIDPWQRREKFLTH